MGKPTANQVARTLDARKYADMDLPDAAEAIWNEQFERYQETAIRIVSRMTGRTAEVADPWQTRPVVSVDGVEFTVDGTKVFLLHSCDLCGETHPMDADDLRAVGRVLKMIEERDGRCKDCREAVQIARRQKAAQKEVK